MSSTRRSFLVGSAAAASLAAFSRPFSLSANPLGFPIGAQLYVVGELLEKNYEQTLQQVAAIGYKEVEAAGFFGHKPAEVKKIMDNVGLHCVSLHMWPDISQDQLFECANVLRARYVVVSAMPPELLKKKMGTEKFDPTKFLAMVSRLTADDFKTIGESCDRLGEQAKAAGLKLAYHNHNYEFKPNGAQTGFDILLANTSPDLVCLELDCAWAGAAGKNVPSLIRTDAKRIRLLHIKNYKKLTKPTYSLEDRPEFTYLADGDLDYVKIFAAAKSAPVEHYFVEHEPPYTTIKPMDVLKSGYEYLHKLS